MAKIQYKGNDHELFEGIPFLIGRDKSNDLVIGLKHVCVSRFHATVFNFKDGLYLLNHSLNGMRYFPDGCDKRDAADTLLESCWNLQSFSDSYTLNKSKRELKHQQKLGVVPEMPNYKRGALKHYEDMAPILDMLQDPNQLEIIVSACKPLNRTGDIYLCGFGIEGSVLLRYVADEKKEKPNSCDRN